MINFCTKFGFDILFLSGSYDTHNTRQTSDDGRGQCHGYGITDKHPIGELKYKMVFVEWLEIFVCEV